jgi:excisionase family DNA binding protein
MNGLSPEFLTVAELAERLRIHPKTVLRYVRSRSHPLPHVRLPGGMVRLRLSDVDRWLGGREGR